MVLARLCYQHPLTSQKELKAKHIYVSFALGKIEKNMGERKRQVVDMSISKSNRCVREPQNIKVWLVVLTLVDYHTDPLYF